MIHSIKAAKLICILATITEQSGTWSNVNHVILIEQSDMSKQK